MTAPGERGGSDTQSPVLNGGVYSNYDTVLTPFLKEKFFIEK